MQDLTKKNPRETLQVGEPYTFLKSDKLPSVAAIKVGMRIDDWWATNEPGRLFLVTAVHEDSIETTYLGFQCMPGSFVTQAEFDKAQQELPAHD